LFLTISTILISCAPATTSSSSPEETSSSDKNQESQSSSSVPYIYDGFVEGQTVTTFTPTSSSGEVPVRHVSFYYYSTAPITKFFLDLQFASGDETMPNNTITLSVGCRPGCTTTVFTNQKDSEGRVTCDGVFLEVPEKDLIYSRIIKKTPYGLL
jgi:hypothetical protein